MLPLEAFFCLIAMITLFKILNHMIERSDRLLYIQNMRKMNVLSVFSAVAKPLLIVTEKKIHKPSASMSKKG